jgi:hypothetical protein
MNRDEIGYAAFDIASHYHDMTLELIKLEKRTLLIQETGDWAVAKLSRSREYQKQAEKIIKKYGDKVEKETNAAVSQAYVERSTELLHIKPVIGFAPNVGAILALQNDIASNFRIAQYSALRTAEDIYRNSVIQAAQLYVGGQADLFNAVDVATAEFRAKGINSIVYANGNRVNIASYAEMALRTVLSRSAAEAQGQVMDEWGEHLIIMASLGSTCPLCAPWQGRVLIDDVYAHGTSAEGDYPLLSTAISEGLFHPNCRHVPGSPYFEDISSKPKPKSKEEVQARYEAEQQQRYLERQKRYWLRQEAGLSEPDKQAKARLLVKSYNKRLREHIKANPEFKRQWAREVVR